MTHDEIMADITDRIDRAIIDLAEHQKEIYHPLDVARLAGKIQGMRSVKDWLRSYPNGVDG